jgi:hypothetical protein
MLIHGPQPHRAYCLFTSMYFVSVLGYSKQQEKPVVLGCLSLSFQLGSTLTRNNDSSHMVSHPFPRMSCCLLLLGVVDGSDKCSGLVQFRDHPDDVGMTSH